MCQVGREAPTAVTSQQVKPKNHLTLSLALGKQRRENDLKGRQNTSATTATGTPMPS